MLPSEAVRVAGLGVQVLSVRCTDIAVLVEREHGHGELGSVAGQGGERLGYLQRGVEREQRVRRAPVKRADRLGDITVTHIAPALAVRAALNVLIGAFASTFAAPSASALE